MNSNDKNILPPPTDTEFWALFDYFWDNGLGRELDNNGEPIAWSATALEAALGHEVDVRSIENWRSRKFMPTRENIRKLCWVISGGDNGVRREWSDALIVAWREEKRKNRSKTPSADQADVENVANMKADRKNPWWWNYRTPILLLAVITIGSVAWVFLAANPKPAVMNLRICDEHYFDKEIKDCTQHVSVFVEGVEEVFLSFDFVNVPDGVPFERWWIHNGERVAGRTSFNDVAWPGYTFWRPEGAVKVGQYVVRVVVDGQVFTQTFYVQKEGYTEQ